MLFFLAVLNTNFAFLQGLFLFYLSAYSFTWLLALWGLSAAASILDFTILEICALSQRILSHFCISVPLLFHRILMNLLNGLSFHYGFIRNSFNLINSCNQFLLIYHRLSLVLVSTLRSLYGSILGALELGVFPDYPIVSWNKL